MQDIMKNCIKMLNSQDLIAFYVGKASVMVSVSVHSDSYNICLGCVHKRRFSTA